MENDVCMKLFDGARLNTDVDVKAAEEMTTTNKSPVKLNYESMTIFELQFASQVMNDTVLDKLDLIKSLQGAFNGETFDGTNVKAAFVEGADLHQVVIHLYTENAEAFQIDRINEVMQWVISSYRFLKIYFNIYQNSTIDKKEHWVELAIK